MRYLILFLASVFSFSIQAQTTLSFLSRCDLAKISGYENERFVFLEKSDIELGVRTSIGVQMTLNTAANQSMVAGVEYVNSGFNAYRELTSSNDFDPVTGNIVSSSSYNATTRYEFIALPLGYRFYRDAGEWSMYGEFLAISMAYLRTVKHDEFKFTGVTNRGKETEIEHDPSIQDFQLAAGAALGIERTIFNSWTIAIQPTFRMNFTPIQVASFSVRPWTAGLQLNIGRILNAQISEN